MAESAARLFFVVTTVFTAVLGVSWLAAPAFMLDQWGVPDADAATVYMSRRYAVMFLGYTTLLWLARHHTGTPAGRAICAGGAVVTGVMALLSLQGVLSGVVGPFAWSAVVAEILLAVFFARAWARG